VTFISDILPALTAETHVRLENLLMGPGTDYAVGPGFNPNVFPDLSPTDVQAPLTDGMIGGLDLLGSRRIPVPLTVSCLSKDAAYDALRALGYAWRPRTANVPLYWRDNVNQWFVLGRPRLVNPDMSLIHFGLIEVEARFEALDPRIYEDVLYVASTDGPAVVVNNDGTLPAPWLATLTGPLTNPSIVHSSGATVSFELVLAEGATATVEVTQRAGGVLRVAGVWAGELVLPGSEWFLLDPGHNTFRLTASAGGGTLDAEWRSCHLI